MIILVTRKDDGVGSQPAWVRMALAGGASF
jgi:hypothetical protein